jgi:hypothetical protein
MIKLLHDINSGKDKAGAKLTFTDTQEARLVELEVAEFVETPKKVKGAEKAPTPKEETKPKSKTKETK